VQRVIGDSGASIISRVMGLVLASVAVASVLGGIDQYYGLSESGDRSRLEREDRAGLYSPSRFVVRVCAGPNPSAGAEEGRASS